MRIASSCSLYTATDCRISGRSASDKAICRNLLQVIMVSCFPWSLCGTKQERRQASSETERTTISPASYTHDTESASSGRQSSGPPNIVEIQPESNHPVSLCKSLTMQLSCTRGVASSCSFCCQQQASLASVSTSMNRQLQWIRRQLDHT